MPAHVRPVEPKDYRAWQPLWQGYNAFYERTVADDVTAMTWARFFVADEPVHALVAEADGQLVGMVHYIFHRNTGTIKPVCYLQDLFTAEAARGTGIGRALIEGVYEAARRSGSPRVYWNTHETNTRAMALYDKVATRSGFIQYRKQIGTP